MDLIVMVIGLVLFALCAVGMLSAVFKNSSGQFLACAVGAGAGLILATAANQSLLGG